MHVCVGAYVYQERHQNQQPRQGIDNELISLKHEFWQFK